MCQAYEAEAAFVGWLEQRAPLCPCCRERKALVYPHCGRCQAEAFQAARAGRLVCSCSACLADWRAWHPTADAPELVRGIP